MVFSFDPVASALEDCVKLPADRFLEAERGPHHSKGRVGTSLSAAAGGARPIMVRDGVKSSLPLVAARSFRVFSRARLQQASGRRSANMRLVAEGGETMLVGEEVPVPGRLLTAAVRRGCCPARQDRRAR